MEQVFSKEQVFSSENKINKEFIIEKLREHGYRITKQRQILLDIILGKDCTSCKEIYYKANEKDTSIGMATVYRMISILEEIGIFSRKNFYQISFCMNCEKENACVIIFDDKTYCQLSAKTWYDVVFQGLKQCGYGEEKKIIGIKLAADIICSHKD